MGTQAGRLAGCEDHGRAMPGSRGMYYRFGALETHTHTNAHPTRELPSVRTKKEESKEP